jgi:IPT/TIG domain-containing protein
MKILRSDRRLFFGVGDRSPLNVRDLVTPRSGGTQRDVLFPLFFPPSIQSVTPSSGVTLGGETIVIAGSQFLQGATVFFGLNQATVLSNTGSNITVLDPAGAAGAVTVTVVNPDGQIGTRANGFTYRSLIIPDDGATIFHLYVSNGQAKNVFGALVESGTVPRIGSTAMGFAGKSAEGIGPFSSVNFFSGPAGIFNFTDHLWFTLVARTPAGVVGNIPMIFAAYSGTNGSNAAGFNSTGAVRDGTHYQNQFSRFKANDSFNLPTPNVGDAGITFNTIFVTSFGVEGSNYFVKKDIGVPAQTNVLPSGGFDAFTGTPSVGKGPNSPTGGTIDPFSGVVFEIRVTRTVPTQAALDALHTAIFS